MIFFIFKQESVGKWILVFILLASILPKIILLRFDIEINRDLREYCSKCPLQLLQDSEK